MRQSASVLGQHSATTAGAAGVHDELHSPSGAGDAFIGPPAGAGDSDDGAHQAVAPDNATAPHLAVPPRHAEGNSVEFRDDDRDLRLEQHETRVIASGSRFGRALGQQLSQLPATAVVRESSFILPAWLTCLDHECSFDHEPVSGGSDSGDELTAEYAEAFDAACRPGPPAADAVAAFSLGTLASLFDDEASFERVDAFIRENPPQWQAADESAATEDPDLGMARTAAHVYLSLRSGFDVLPPGTPVHCPTDTANYRSVEDNIDAVRAEMARLLAAGHLVTFAEAQRRFPSLRRLSQPEHIMALGAVVKRRPDGTLKTRMVVDPSRATAATPPHPLALSLNDHLAELNLIPPTRLPTVHQAARALSRNCYAFRCDAVDAYMQTKHSVDSLRLVGVRFEGTVYVYNSCCFGLAHMPSYQQTLAVLVSRIVMRRWADRGLDVGPKPSYQHSQEWPTPGDGKVHLLAYIDDWLAINFPSQQTADIAYKIFLDTAAELGLQLQYAESKTVPPANTGTEFLGVILSPRSMTLSLSAERISRMEHDLASLQMANSCNVGELQRLVGVYSFAVVVFSLCRPYLRQLLNVLRSLGPRPSRFRRVTLTPEARADIEMWLRILRVMQLNSRPVRGVPLHRSTMRAELYTDASFSGAAWFWGRRWRAWKWPNEWRTRIGDFDSDDAIAICELEALALLVAVRDIVGGGFCSGRRLVAHIDNLPLVYMLEKHATRSPACLPVLKELTFTLLAYGAELVPRHIPSEENEVADQLSRVDELRADELHATLRRWCRSQPDTTGWSPRPPLRPDLLRHTDTHPYSAPGMVHHGLSRCTCQFVAV